MVSKTGTPGDDSLDGTGGDDFLFGGAGRDTLRGFGGNDELHGGADGDFLHGGLGDDIYHVGFGDQLFEEAGQGTDTVISQVDWTLGDNIENLTLATGALMGWGNSLANTLVGNAGNNRLDGGAGADVMRGLDGGDYYWVDHAGDQVVEIAGSAGSDQVLTSIDYVLPAEVENLHLRGAAASGTGNSLGNRLEGRSGDQLLNGLAGDDRIYGGFGQDTLRGGSGNDLLHGGEGPDAMVGNSGDDIYFVGQAGDAVFERAGEGFDRVSSAISYVLADGLEALILQWNYNIDGTGNGADNILDGSDGGNHLSGLGGNDDIDGRGGDDLLEGGDGDDLLNGGHGLDVMRGGAGDDIYGVDNEFDFVEETAGGGHDIVRSSVSFTLGDFVQDLVLIGRDVNGTGNNAINVITGSIGANRLEGLGGNDTLNGGSGIDTLIGGFGNDTYFVDTASDRIVELAGEGADRVLTRVTYLLGGDAEVERLSAADTRAAHSMTLNGNDFAQHVIGNAGTNVLRGFGGDDILAGLGGSDSLYGGLGNDRLVGGGAGADRFHFDTALDETANVDRIADFSHSDDTIYLARSVFGGAAAGRLGADAFERGTGAQDAEDRILYDSASGRIFYDADGTGAAAAVLFAVVNPGVALDHTDFVALG